ncbi:MAG: hypothetical protein HQM13_15765 [SAR324 cluster bacterium]|nr:hypothetical protein [SAR324 cluster bacterium]
MKLIDTSRMPTTNWTMHAPRALMSHNARTEKSEKRKGLVFHKGWLNPNEVIENGEIAVSLHQTAIQEIRNIQRVLRETENCLLKELSHVNSKSCPQSDLNKTVREHLDQVRLLANETVFKERHLLNGKLSVCGKGRVTRVLSGAPASQGRLSNLVRVELLRLATHSVLTGYETLTDDLVRRESQIILSENGNMAKYTIKSGETVESLLSELQQLVTQKGLDLEIQLNDEGHLQVRHRQYGSCFVFSGRSRKTRILSKQPDSFHFCQLGENCIGKVNGHFVKSRGQLLLCGSHLQGLEGVSILWEGEELGVDYLTLSHNAVAVPGGEFARKPGLWISIRSCDPETLAQGVNNKSGFNSLAKISQKSWQSTYDSLYLVQLSLEELEECLIILEARKRHFEEMTMRALETTEFETIKKIPGNTHSENIAQMALMLEEAFMSKNRI